MKVTCASPLLDRVTDAKHMHPHLSLIVHSRWSEARIAAIDVPRVMPRPSGEILVQYRLTYDDVGGSSFKPAIVFGQHYPETVDLPTGDPPEKETSVWLPELRLRIWLFPNDPELDQMGLLFDPASFHEVYDKELENVGFDRVAMGTPSTILGYRLGRRCVVRVIWQPKNGQPPPQSPKHDVVIKMSRKRNALSLWTRWRQLEHDGFGYKSADSMIVPKSLLLHQSTGAIFQEFAYGTSIHDMVGSDELTEGCAAAGRILSKLHRTRISGLGNYSVDDEIGHLVWLVESTASSFPSLRDDLQDRLAALTTNRPSAERAVPVTCHRDFYDKQILCDGDQTVLLDCDTLALADPALDCGNFIAHLQWRTHQNPDRSDTLRRGIEAFTQSYSWQDGSLTARLPWWTAASLLRLACLYAWRPRWRQQVPSLLRSRRLQGFATAAL